MDRFNRPTIRDGTIGPFVLRTLSSIQNGIDMSYPLPATQTDLSDVLGLSLVHTNRCAKLRSEGLATFSRQTVTIHDWDKLQRVAEFNPEYLHLEAKIAAVEDH